MFHILYGQDSFSVKEAMDEIKQSLGEPQLLSTNTTVFEGQKLTLPELQAACDTVPFLAERRLVVVEGLLSRFDPHRGARQPKRPASGEKHLEAWLGLKDHVGVMPPSTALVLVDGAVDRNNPLLKALASAAKVREYRSLDDNALREWVVRRVKKLDGQISAPAAKALVDLVGGNLWVMSSELEKLCLYAHGRSIEEKDVRLQTSSAREFTVFNLVDAVIERRTPTAIQLLHQLSLEGAAAPFVLFMLTRQFRHLLQLKDLAGQRLSQWEMAGRLGVPSMAVGRMLQQQASYPVKRLEDTYRKLLETDISIKTGRWSGEQALELLIVDLCQK
ncbi:MAG: DNA polymerase III subunit delta [Dehalococcoidia bacterium]|nr:DNA polymerase III subunit delta [Dehalococcoidia bacterium]